MPSDNEVRSELDLRDPPQQLVEWAKENINENPETRDQVLQDLRDMIFEDIGPSVQKNIERGECTPHRTDDSFLLRFLRARYFIVERAHRLLVNYCEFKESNPEFFEDVDLQHLLNNIGDRAIITVPPYREQTGRRILLYRIGNWDPEEIQIEELFQSTLIILELAILEPRFQILGGVGIFDLGGLSLQQSWYLTPSIAHKVVQIIVTSFPMRVAALHIVNQSWIFDMVYNIFKPFLDERMKERIFFHGEDMDSLHQHIDPKHLPERYGGIHPDYNYNDWIEGFEKNDRILGEMKSLGYRIPEKREECDKSANACA